MTTSILKKSLTESKFNMWRACMAVTRLDGVITDEEMQWAFDKINFIPFSKEQKEIISDDFKNGTKIQTLVPLITDKKDLAFLLHMTRVIGNIDHEYNEIEKNAFEYINDVVQKGLDLNELNRIIKDNKMDHNHDHLEMTNLNGKSSFDKFFHALSQLMKG